MPLSSRTYPCGPQRHMMMIMMSHTIYRSTASVRGVGLAGSSQVQSQVVGLRDRVAIIRALLQIHLQLFVDSRKLST